MAPDKQYLFIIGSPKSGTSWLRAMLAAHPLVVCTTVELTLFSRYIAPWIKAWNFEADNIEQGRWYQGLPFLWTEDEFYDFLREFIGRVYERVVTTKPKATHILDKHPAYAMHVEEINKLLPKARFIHIIRDGRDVACSMVAARKNIGYGTETISESAMAWQSHVRAARKASQYPGRYLEIRYEDLLTAGVDTLQSVFDFCNLPTSIDQIVTIIEDHQFEKMKANRGNKVHRAFYRKGKAGSWRADMEPLQRYFFDQIAGDLLRELEYVSDNWWAESIIQKVTFPLRTSVSRKRKSITCIIRILLGPTLSKSISSIRSRIRRKGFVNT